VDERYLADGYRRGVKFMRFIDRLLLAADRVAAPKGIAAHCDLPCGVYDPAQARIDENFRIRATFIKEERADLVKHHLWVLWTDYFKPEHLEKYPQLHESFWKATKTAGEAKKTNDEAVGQRLLDEIDGIAEIFWETKK
jgi:nickel superoxide dismutase